MQWKVINRKNIMYYFFFDESKINVAFTKNKNHNIKNGIITIIYRINFLEPNDKNEAN